jgi:hypothetical protein
MRHKIQIKCQRTDALSIVMKGSGLPTSKGEKRGEIDEAMEMARRICRKGICIKISGFFVSSVFGLCIPEHVLVDKRNLPHNFKSRNVHGTSIIAVR